ncbi:M48 family metalloprotease [Nitriliruptoraceae bacterium ZYF776]|nr:M48 family metalloprotease [Profundirhabdus halotolerans]
MTRADRGRTVVVLAVALAVVGLVVTVWRPVAPTAPGGAVELARFDPAVLATIREYRAPRQVVALVATALQVLVPLAVAWTPLGRRWLRRLAGPRAHAPVRAGLSTAGVAVLVSVATLPLSAWSALVHEERWDLRVRSTTGWLRDWLVASSGRWLLLGVAVTVVAWAAHRWPRTWPYRLTLATTAATAVFVLVHPLLIQPLLLPTEPLPDGPVRDAVEEVLTIAGHEGAPIVVGQASLRTTRANALVTGLGPTERVVLYDTLLEVPTDRLAGIVAHELAHQEHGDLWRGALGSATLALPLLLGLRRLLGRAAARGGDIRGRTDPRLAALVVAAVVLVELATSPLVSAVSRRLEAAADHRAVVWTQDAGSLVRTVRAFVVRDLADPDPPRWAHLLWGTHPTPDQRIRAAVATAEQLGVEVPTLAEVMAEEADLAHPRLVDADR